MNGATCRDLLRCLHAYIDGELAASQVLALDEHIESCPTCASRVAFGRATRRSVRSACRGVTAPSGLRDRVAAAMANEAVEDERVESAGHRMLSLRIVGPLAAAACVALIWAGISTRTAPTAKLALPPSPSTSPSTASATMLPVDSLLETFVAQHADSLPPETTSPTDLADFDNFVGVPVRSVTLRDYQSRLLGARRVYVERQRAAMLQYVLSNGQRVSVYVYNPRGFRIAASPKLRRNKQQTTAVYVGYVRGYSVALTNKRDVGYAVASDLDEQENSRLVLAVAPQ